MYYWLLIFKGKLSSLALDCTKLGSHCYVKHNVQHQKKRQKYACVAGSRELLLLQQISQSLTINFFAFSCAKG